MHARFGRNASHTLRDARLARVPRIPPGPSINMKVFETNVLGYGCLGLSGTEISHVSFNISGSRSWAYGTLSLKSYNINPANISQKHYYCRKEAMMMMMMMMIVMLMLMMVCVPIIYIYIYPHTYVCVCARVCMRGFRASCICIHTMCVYIHIRMLYIYIQ